MNQKTEAGDGGVVTPTAQEFKHHGQFSALDIATRWAGKLGYELAGEIEAFAEAYATLRESQKEAQLRKAKNEVCGHPAIFQYDPGTLEFGENSCLLCRADSLQKELAQAEVERDNLQMRVNNFLSASDNRGPGKLHEYLTSLRARIRELEEAQRWIPVEEKPIPEDDGFLAEIEYLVQGHLTSEIIACRVENEDDLITLGGDDIGWTTEVVRRWKPLGSAPGKERE
jgi:hypothetical protein